MTRVPTSAHALLRSLRRLALIASTLIVGAATATAAEAQPPAEDIPTTSDTPPGNPSGPDEGPPGNPSGANDAFSDTPLTEEELRLLEAETGLSLLPESDGSSDDGTSSAAGDGRTPGDGDTGLTLIGGRRRAGRVVGSAHVIGKDHLERFEQDDIHRTLREVPGVYVRDEDGAGLRPNIGLRGASSDRSAKVTLLEDGVLFGPAPYAAPAAYYFPLTTRMTAIEIWKGPAAIRQGPHTVGGAINLRTRAIPFSPAATVDVGIGLVGPGREQSRLHGTAGGWVRLPGALDWLEAGALVEGARVQSEGFKIIDGDPNADTGFLRDDVMLKLALRNDVVADIHHSLGLKLGLQREESRETYLGLSEEDFRDNPNRRYAASADDAMTWARTQLELRYRIESAWGDLDVVAYRHDLARSWNKVNGVRGAPNLHDVLGFADVGRNRIFYDRLQSSPEVIDDGSAVLIGPNRRTYVSQGVATVAATDFDLPLTEGVDGLVLSQRFEAGLRLHQDGINRDHREGGFYVVDGNLIADGRGEVQTANNSANASALALYVSDEVRLGPVAVVPGVRLELIEGRFENRLDPATATKTSQQIALLPGIGAAWAPLPWLTVLAGVHRGFSPVAPGQLGEVRPEESTNGEFGARVDVARHLGLAGEVIGFVSHYDNIVGECTFSAGCIDDTGVQQNGGAALISGVEVAVRHTLPLKIWRATDNLHINMAGTFTNAQFLTSFSSSHPLFGDVVQGDSLAYLPALQGALTIGGQVGPVDGGLSVGLVSAMRDRPGQEAEIPVDARLDAQAVVDVVVSTELWDGLRLGVRLDNLLNQQALVSRRPFGARPGKPRSILISLETDIGG